MASNGSVARTFTTLGSDADLRSLHAGRSSTINVVGALLCAQMNGANERPAVPSTANGSAVFTRRGKMVSYTVADRGLASNPTGLHIHAPANATVNAGMAVDLLRTTVLGPNGVRTGTFTGTDMRAVGGQPAGSLDSMMARIRTGNAHRNVPSTTDPGGEVRGQAGTP